MRSLHAANGSPVDELRASARHFRLNRIGNRASAREQARVKAMCALPASAPSRRTRRLSGAAVAALKMLNGLGAEGTGAAVLLWTLARRLLYACRADIRQGRLPQQAMRAWRAATLETTRGNWC
jgi:hypothetical protein